MTNNRATDDSTAKALIELRLQRWAAWDRREADNGLGYPKKSAFWGRSVSSEYNWTPADEAEAWETGQAIQRLDHQYQIVIRAKWIETGLMKSKYSALHVTRQKFADIYNRAINKLRIELSALQQHVA